MLHRSPWLVLPLVMSLIALGMAFYADEPFLSLLLLLLCGATALVAARKSAGIFATLVVMMSLLSWMFVMLDLPRLMFFIWSTPSRLNWLGKSLLAALLCLGVLPVLASRASGRVLMPLGLVSLGTLLAIFHQRLNLERYESVPLVPLMLSMGAGVLALGPWLSRLWQRDRRATLFALFIIYVMAIPTVVATDRFSYEIDKRYWMWQGQRQAAADFKRGFLALKGMGMGGGTLGDLEPEKFAPYGLRIELEVVSAGCFVPRKHGEKGMGYNEEARKLIEARYGSEFLR